MTARRKLCAKELWNASGAAQTKAAGQDKKGKKTKGWGKPGLVLIVWEIESDGLIDVSETGLAAHDVYTPVVIEENPTVSRSETGIGIEAEKALQYVLEEVAGKAGGSRRYIVMDPPFKNFGKVNGIRRMVVNLSLRSFVKSP